MTYRYIGSIFQARATRWLGLCRVGVRTCQRWPASTRPAGRPPAPGRPAAGGVVVAVCPRKWTQEDRWYFADASALLPWPASRPRPSSRESPGAAQAPAQPARPARRNLRRQRSRSASISPTTTRRSGLPTSTTRASTPRSCTSSCIGPLLAAANASLQNQQIEELVNEGAKAVDREPGDGHQPRPGDLLRDLAPCEADLGRHDRRRRQGVHGGPRVQPDLRPRRLRLHQLPGEVRLRARPRGRPDLIQRRGPDERVQRVHGRQRPRALPSSRTRRSGSTPPR